MGSCHFHPCYRGEMLIEQVLFHASSVYRLKVSTFKSLSKHFWYISIVLSAILSSCYSDNSLYTILYSFVSWERNLVNWWIPHFPTIWQNSSAQTNHYDYFYNLFIISLTKFPFPIFSPNCFATFYHYWLFIPLSNSCC